MKVSLKVAQMWQTAKKRSPSSWGPKYWVFLSTTSSPSSPSAAFFPFPFLATLVTSGFASVFTCSSFCYKFKNL
jgi:hypothetical protein